MYALLVLLMLLQSRGSIENYLGISKQKKNQKNHWGQKGGSFEKRCEYLCTQKKKKTSNFSYWMRSENISIDYPPVIQSCILNPVRRFRLVQR